MLDGMTIVLFLLYLFTAYIKDLSSLSGIYGFNDFMNLFPEGLIGLGLIIYSIKLINLLIIRKAFIYGIIGSLLLGLNFLLSFFVLEFNLIRIKTPIDYAYTGIFWPIFSLLYLILAFSFFYNKGIEDEAIVRKAILELGTNYTRVKIREIAENSKIRHGIIINVAKTMINNKEIYAEYFKSTNSIAFDLRANINEIDNLMNFFRKWETEQVGKKLN